MPTAGPTLIIARDAHRPETNHRFTRARTSPDFARARPRNSLFELLIARARRDRPLDLAEIDSQRRFRAKLSGRLSGRRVVHDEGDAREIN